MHTGQIPLPSVGDAGYEILDWFGSHRIPVRAEVGKQPYLVLEAIRRGPGAQEAHWLPSCQDPHFLRLQRSSYHLL